MSDQVREKANELSLLLVMSSEGDTIGLTMLLELCDDIAKLVKGSAEHGRLVEAIDFLKSKKKSADLFSILQSFTSNLLKYLENAGEVTFSNEQGQHSTTRTVSVDISTVDERFLAECIETHAVLLEDFEALLLEYKNTEENADAVQAEVKRYVHSLKGDSGSIGLIGIERVCHILEDAVVESPIKEMTSSLLHFKAWVAHCFDAWVKGDTPSRTADEFLAEIDLAHEGSAPIIGGGVHKDSAVVEATPHQHANVTYTVAGEKELLIDFAVEAEEHLHNVENVILESAGNYSKNSIDTIFRGVHSLKGGSAYFELEEMVHCSHILENFLSEVREGTRPLDPALGALLLRYIDLQKDVLTRAKKAATADGVMTRAKASDQFLEALKAYEKGELHSLGSVSEKQDGAQSAAVADDGGRLSARAPGPASDGESSSDKINLKSFVKVETARLDLLIDSIGEMVIYSSMLIRQCRELLDGNEAVMNTTHQVEKFSRDLQDIGISMRLVPIKGLFQKMSRLVWDTSKKLGKDVVFTMEGEDTELDRNLIDKLADPLMHMVRNALDHGVEPPAEREAKKKPRAGKVMLSASHAGGSIHIKIQDDGRGLDPEKLIAKAIEKGIVTSGQGMTEAEVFSLIFAPGFSTAAAVTDISGRGVGMDVVKNNVESLRGRIHIASTIEQGSIFTIEIPLTLAIIDGIQVLVGRETFIIPSLSIIEFIRPKESMLSRPLERGDTFEFRGKYLPLYRLGQLYGIQPRHDQLIDSTIVIVECNNEHIAIVVDEILGEVSTVIKSLGGLFEDGKGIAGCAIMPKGNVALILDVRSLVQLARTDYPHRGLPPSEQEQYVH